MRRASLVTTAALAFMVATGCQRGGAGSAAEVEWGPEKDGIAVWLLPLEKEYVLGRRMRFRAELKNETSTRMHFDQQMADRRSLVITGPDGERAPYIGPTYSTLAHYRHVDPGKVVVLFEVEISSIYYIGKPGRYEVQYPAGGLYVFEKPEGWKLEGCFVLRTGEGPDAPRRTVHILPSNTLEVEVLPGKVAPSQVVANLLLDVLPERKRLRGTSDGEVTPTGREPVSGAEVRLGSIMVWETRRAVDPVPAKPGKARVASEYWGENERGHVYVRMPPAAEYRWPDAREKIAKALDVAETAPPTPDEVARVIAMREALKAGDTKKVQALIEARPELVHARLGRGGREEGWVDGTALCWAARLGRSEIARLLADHGADLGAADERLGTTPLHCSARAGSAEITSLLIDRGADIDARDRNGKTPLYHAAEEGHAEVVAVLLKGGADPNEDGGKLPRRTPLHAAAQCGRRDVLDLLLAHGAEVNPKRADTSPLHTAAWMGRGEAVELLLKRGADVKADRSWNRGWTPLHNAAFKGHKEIVDLLLTAGAPVDARERKGRTPLDLAEERGHKKIAEMLRGYGGKE